MVGCVGLGRRVFGVVGFFIVWSGFSNEMVFGLSFLE